MKVWKAIAAMSENRVIGSGSKIPWHIPEDFKWFKKITMGHTIVMGRKTFESIGKALPGRETIVISRGNFTHPGILNIHSLNEIESRASLNNEVFICGGAEIYQQTLKRCSELFLTIVKKDIKGDVYFPAFEDYFKSSKIIREEAEFRIIHYENNDPLPLSSKI